MAKENYAAYATGKDAAYIKPKLVPNYELMARDDSGGPDWDPHTAEFGDGGFVIGQDEKAHISAHGGGEHKREGTELDDNVTRTEEYDRETRTKHKGRKGETSRSVKEAEE